MHLKSHISLGDLGLPPRDLGGPRVDPVWVEGAHNPFLSVSTASGRISWKFEPNRGTFNFWALGDLGLPHVTLKGPGWVPGGSQGPITHSYQFLRPLGVFPESLSLIGAKMAEVQILTHFGPPKLGGTPK